MTEELPNEMKFYKQYWKIVFDILFVGMIPILLFSVSVPAFSRSLGEDQFRTGGLATLMLGIFFTIVLIPFWRMILRAAKAPDPVIELNKDGFYLRSATQDLIQWDNVETVLAASPYLSWFLITVIHFRLTKDNGLDCQRRRFGRVARTMLTFAVFSESGSSIAHCARLYKHQHSNKA